jgi:hypothetical protein
MHDGFLAIDTDVRLGTDKPLVAFPCLGMSGSRSPCRKIQSANSAYEGAQGSRVIVCSG